jgi:hypothetical protein
MGPTRLTHATRGPLIQSTLTGRKTDLLLCSLFIVYLMTPTVGAKYRVYDNDLE